MNRNNRSTVSHFGLISSCKSISYLALSLVAILLLVATPIATTAKADTFVETISAGGFNHTCRINFDGTLACWGDDAYGQSTPPSGQFTQVSAGSGHNCGLKTDGTLACWGWNDYGQSTSPTGQFTQVSADSHHTCGLNVGGTLVCWGSDAYGKATPPTGQFTQVSAGFGHNCGLKTDGTLACWGINDGSSFDYGQSTPPTGQFTQVSAGGFHACGIKSDGTLVCWGANDMGQSAPPTGQFTQVSAGDYHNCGIKSDGTLACWGYNYDGQAIAPPGQFSQVSAGYSHTCGLKTDGSPACWGSDYYNESTPPYGDFSELEIAMMTFSNTQWEWQDLRGDGTPDPDEPADINLVSIELDNTISIVGDSLDITAKYLGAVDVATFNAEFGSSFVNATIHKLAYLRNADEFYFDEFEDLGDIRTGFPTLEAFINAGVNDGHVYDMIEYSSPLGLRFASGGIIELVNTQDDTIVDATAGTYEIVESVTVHGQQVRVLKTHPTYEGYDDIWHKSFAEKDSVIYEGECGEAGDGAYVYQFDGTGKEEFTDFVLAHQFEITDDIEFEVDMMGFQTEFDGLTAIDPTLLINASPLYDLETDLIHNVGGNFSGSVEFRNTGGELIDIPNDAWVRLVPSIYQNDQNHWSGLLCKINSDGTYGDMCYQSYDEYDEGLWLAFNNASETFQVVVFKNHIIPQEFYWNCAEDVYKYVGDNIPHGSLSDTIIVLEGDYRDRSGEYCGGNVKDDFGGEGNADILLRNTSTGQLYLYEMDGSARTGSNIGALSTTWTVRGIGDLGGDGKADILIRNSSGQLYLYEMDGNVKTGSNIGALSTAWIVRGIGDFGGDGKDDILIRNISTGQLYLYEMDGNTRTGSDIGALSTAWAVAGVGDFGGDGKADILIRNISTGQLYLYEMDGNARTGSNIGALSTAWEVSGIGDFGGDGKADILIRNISTGQLFLYEMDGNVRTGSNIGALSTDWTVERVADYGGDGKADILIRNSTGQLYLYEMDGNTVTLSNIGALNTAWAVEVQIPSLPPEPE